MTKKRSVTLKVDYYGELLLLFVVMLGYDCISGEPEECLCWHELSCSVVTAFSIVQNDVHGVCVSMNGVNSNVT